MEEFLSEEKKGMKHLARLEEIGLKDLVRADGSYVRIESLRAETIGLLFYSLVDLLPLLELREAYDRLRRAHGDDAFQIVVVAGSNGVWEEDRKLFDQEFKGMPPQWLAIPFDDWLCRAMFQKTHGYTNDYSELHIIDKGGRPLAPFALNELSRFGPAWFPFTADKMIELKCDRAKMVESKSLEAILGTDSRDFVITITDQGQQTKVPISQLKGMVIAVYICRGVPFPEIERDEKKLILNFLLQNCGLNFKLLLINADHAGGYTDKASFLKMLQRLPGSLALPFQDEKIWALTSIFSRNYDVGIVGADGTIFFNISQVIKEYGSGAFSFTIESAVDAELQRLKRMNLVQVLDELAVRGLFKKEKVGQDVAMIYHGVSSLDLLKAPNEAPNEKKCVVLYIDDRRGKRCLNRLMECCDKEDGSSFQVIFLSLAIHRFAEDFNSMPMSWLGLAIPGYFDKPKDFSKKLGFLFPSGGFVMVFDGSSGILHRMARLESFGCCDTFPFIQPNDFSQFVSAYVKKWYSD